MAYTAVKLADVNKAIAAVKTAQSNYDTAIKNTSETSAAKTAVNTALKNLDAARAKLDSLQSDFNNEKYLTTDAGYKTANTNLTNAQKALDAARAFIDSEDYLKKNAAYQNALKNITAKETARENAQRALDNANDKNRASLQKAYNSADAAVNAAYTAKDTAERNARIAAEKSVTTAETAYNQKQRLLDTARNTAQATAQKAIDAQANIINGEKNTKSLERVYDNAQNAYQKIVDTVQPAIDARNDAINNVSNYINNIKDSFGDVKNINDANEVKKLLTDINSAVSATKISDLQTQVKSQLSDFDPIKAFNAKLPELQQEYKQNLELPTLNANQVDNVLKSMANQRIGDGNSLMIPRYQTVGDDYGTKGGSVDGLNLKSVNANILTGAALFNLYKGGSQKTDDFSIADPKIDNVWHSRKATDADFAKAAAEAKVDISGMNRQEAYDAINNQWKDYYSITTRGSLGVDPTTGKTADHWSALYKREGDSLVPMTNQSGAKVVQGFNATWHTPYEDFGSFIAGAMPAIVMALPFVLPGVGNAISSTIGNTLVESAIAPTAFTVGAPAVTLGSIIGPTAVSALSGAIVNGGVALITNGDVGKAMLSGAAGGAASASAADISNKIMGGGETGANNIAAIAKASNLSIPQVQKIIASGVASGLTSLATDPDNAAKNMVFSIASNFSTEEVKNLVTDSIDPKSLSGLQNLAVNATGVVTSAAMNGQDIGAALEKSAQSLALNAAQAQYKYVGPPVNVSSGASGFPINEDLLKTLDLARDAGVDYADLSDIIGTSTPVAKQAEDYYTSLIKSNFDEDITKELKSIFPEMGDSDLKAMANSLVRDVAATSFNLPEYSLQKEGGLPTSPNQLSKENQILYIELLKNGYNENSALLEAALVDPKYAEEANKYLHLQNSFAGPIDSSKLYLINLNSVDPEVKKIIDDKNLKDANSRIKELEKNKTDLENAIAAYGERSQKFPLNPGKTTTFINLSEQKKSTTSVGDQALIDIGGGTSGGSGITNKFVPFQLIGVTTKGDPSFIDGDGEIYTLITVDGVDTLVKPKDIDVLLNAKDDIDKMSVDQKNITAQEAKDLRANAKKDATFSIIKNQNDLVQIDPESKTVTNDIEKLKKEIVSKNTGGNEGAAGGAGSGTASADLINKLLAQSAAPQQSELDKFLEDYYKNNQPADQSNAPTDVKKDINDWFQQNTAKSEDPLKQKLLLVYANDDKIVKQYFDNALKKAQTGGQTGKQTDGQTSGDGKQPTGKNFKEILSDALSSLKSDIDSMFAPGDGEPGAGGTGGDTEGYGTTTGGGTGAGIYGTGTTAAGTGTGTGAGSGSGAADKAAAEKAAMAKRQTYYNQMMGVGSLPITASQGSIKQAGPSEAFYYGKEFGSPTQAISETGELVQKPYQPLSVTQPGKEVAPTGGTGENDVNALLSSILSQGDETSLNDLLEIIGGSQYG